MKVFTEKKVSKMSIEEMREVCSLEFFKFLRKRESHFYWWDLIQLFLLHHNEGLSVEDAVWKHTERLCSQLKVGDYVGDREEYFFRICGVGGYHYCPTWERYAKIINYLWVDGNSYLIKVGNMPKKPKGFEVMF